jgi:ABC-2 type transport system permease protein
MIADILSILWKEFKEMFSQRPSLRGGWSAVLIFTFIFSILLPAEQGAKWVTSSLNLLYWDWVPFLMVSSVVADSFAGERERHTLETLLASRLSDRAILFGKLLASILYGWGLTLGGVLVGLITVNVLHGNGHLLLFPAWLGLSILVASFLIASLAACLGVLISLRASTVRQAQQTLSLITFIPLGLVLLLPLLPSGVFITLGNLVTRTNGFVILLVGAIFLFLLDIALLITALVRFQRNRLILD